MLKNIFLLKTIWIKCLVLFYVKNVTNFSPIIWRVLKPKMKMKGNKEVLRLSGLVVGEYSCKSANIWQLVSLEDFGPQKWTESPGYGITYAQIKASVWENEPSEIPTSEDRASWTIFHGFLMRIAKTDQTVWSESSLDNTFHKVHYL